MNLKSLLQLEELNNYKLHAARNNKFHQPLDVFLRDRNEWDLWNSWQGTKNEFNRDLLVSIIKFYPEPNTWLFGGVYKILHRGPDKCAFSYKVQLLDIGKDLIGRLKLTGSIPRGRAFNLETMDKNLELSEILKKPYSGEIFSGYDNISLDFSMLQIIYKNNRIDWQIALENIAGIYLIIDKQNGKKYVGSAYGSLGIWARWKMYLDTGHGWNKQLIGLSEIEPSYALQNFRITLIEWYPAKIEDKTILRRESFWKNALLSRLYGYNSN